MENGPVLDECVFREPISGDSKLVKGSHMIPYMEINHGRTHGVDDFDI